MQMLASCLVDKFDRGSLHTVSLPGIEADQQQGEEAAPVVPDKIQQAAGVGWASGIGHQYQEVCLGQSGAVAQPCLPGILYLVTAPHLLPHNHTPISYDNKFSGTSCYQRYLQLILSQETRKLKSNQPN